MQAFANVATQPVQRTTQAGGRVYWEFRAAESARNEEKASATWYTVRVFQEEDPGFIKGDFVRIVGKLKLDTFMSREGKPMGVLVLMCYEVKKYDKGGASQATSSSGAGIPKGPTSSIEKSDTKAPLREPIEAAVDDSWLSLVA